MPYVSSSSVQVETWVELRPETEITYQVYPASDLIEIYVGDSQELELRTSEAGLRNCVEAFTGALKAFEAAPDPAGHDDQRTDGNGDPVTVSWSAGLGRFGAQPRGATDCDIAGQTSGGG